MDYKLDYDPLYCKCCDYQAKDNFTYNRHLKSVKHKRNNDLGGKYTCDICCKLFSSPQSLCNHKKECSKQVNLNNDKYYMDMIKMKDDQINFLKEQLEYFKKQNETLQNQVITLQNNNIQQTQQMTQPQNIIVNNQLPQPEKKKKRIAITCKNYKTNIPKVIKEPKELNNVVDDYYKYFDKNYKYNVEDTSTTIASKINSILKSFINSFDDDNAFLYIGKNENNPDNLYYYGKDYDKKFIEDSNIEWYKMDCKVIENIFIDKLYNKIMQMFLQWTEKNNDFNDNGIQTLYMTGMENVNSFTNHIDRSKFYEMIYNKSGKNNSKK